MIHIKKFKLFESNIDNESADVEAYHELYDADFFIAFGFREILIKDKSQISELIKKYNQTYISENEWGGGPVNRKFDEYFINKYKPILGDSSNLRITNPHKPSFYVVLITRYGYLPIGFSLKNKIMSGLYSNTFSLDEKEKMKKDIISIRYSEDRVTMSNLKDYYSNSVIHEMYLFINKYWNKKISDLLNELNIEINFDWEWVEDIK